MSRVVVLAELFVVAFACALLQSTFWLGVIQQAELSLPGVDGPSSMPTQLSTIAFNQLVADGLLLAVVTRLVLSMLILLARSLRQLPSIDRKAVVMAQRFDWVEGFVRLIDRLVVFGILLTACYSAGHPAFPGACRSQYLIAPLAQAGCLLYPN